MFEILIIVVVLLVIFGASKVRGAGSDLGAAVKGFRKALRSPEAPRAAGDQARTPDKNQRVAPDASAAGLLDAEFPEVLAARSRRSRKPDA